jgi:hypothetical protein
MNKRNLLFGAVSLAITAGAIGAGMTASSAATPSASADDSDNATVTMVRFDGNEGILCTFHGVSLQPPGTPPDGATLTRSYEDGDHPQFSTGGEPPDGGAMVGQWTTGPAAGLMAGPPPSGSVAVSSDGTVTSDQPVRQGTDAECAAMAENSPG